jgi:hypothetical protein
MRRFSVLSVAVCAVLVWSVGAAGAVVTQPQYGIAGGTFGYSVFVSEQHEGGTYRSTGQLGSGTYAIDNIGQADECGTSATPSATARFVRSDGAVFGGTVTTPLECGLPRGERLTIELTDGARDLLGANIEFVRTGIATSATPSGGAGYEAFAFAATTRARTRVGYWTVDAAGHVSPFGGVTWFANAAITNAVHIEPTPSRNGYWVVDRDGDVFAFGGARWFGNLGHDVLQPGEEVVHLAAAPDGAGYLIFTSRGLVVQFGSAVGFGDIYGRTIAPIVGAAMTPANDGYYLVASDGGVFAFGKARYRGSMFGTRLNQPVVDIVATPDGNGYWLVASDGGVFAFNTRFLGSLGAVRLARPIVDMVGYGSGYLMVAEDGGIFSFSSRPFFGSLAGTSISQPIVGAATAG